MAQQQYFAIVSNAKIVAFRSRAVRDRFCADHFHVAQPISAANAYQASRAAARAARANARVIAAADAAIARAAA
jgi:hypothetical protein